MNPSKGCGRPESYATYSSLEDLVPRFPDALCVNPSGIGTKGVPGMASLLHKF